jgi:hypothetical protein
MLKQKGPVHLHGKAGGLVYTDGIVHKKEIVKNNLI